jgi:hypothetical protein
MVYYKRLYNLHRFLFYVNNTLISLSFILSMFTSLTRYSLPVKAFKNRVYTPEWRRMLPPVSFIIDHPRFLLAVNFFINSMTNILINIIVAVVVRQAVSQTLVEKEERESYHQAAKSLFFFILVSGCTTMGGVIIYAVGAYAVERGVWEFFYLSVMGLARVSLPLHFSWELLYIPHLMKLLLAGETRRHSSVFTSRSHKSPHRQRTQNGSQSREMV